MDLSFHELNQKIANGKKTLVYDAEEGRAYYTRKATDADDNVVTIREYLPSREEIADILQKTNNERSGLQTVRDFYLANP